MSAITTTRIEMKVSPRLLDVTGRELVVDDGLQRKVGHHSTGNSNRGADGECDQDSGDLFRNPLPKPRRRLPPGGHEFRAARCLSAGRDARKRSISNCPHLRKRISPTAQETRNVGFTVTRFAQNDRGHRMKAYFEFRDNSKISTASAKGPGAVGVLVGIGAHHRAVSGHQSKAFHVIAGKP